MSVFYELPATELVEGLSTDDAQRILDVMRVGDKIQVTVYTPRTDDDPPIRRRQLRVTRRVPRHAGRPVAAPAGAEPPRILQVENPSCVMRSGDGGTRTRGRLHRLRLSKALHSPLCHVSNLAAPPPLRAPSRN